MGRLLAVVPRLHSTSGGSSETELKELAVRQRKLPSASRVVITVTPVANWPSVWRKWALSKARSSARGERVFMVGLSLSAIMPKKAPRQRKRRAGRKQMVVHALPVCVTVRLIGSLTQGES